MPREVPQNDWMAYFLELHRCRGEVKGRTLYLPSPSDIEERKEDLRWLEDCGFSQSFVVNVMEHDNPTIERARQMVCRYGVEETKRRCQAFAAPTEYDEEENNGSELGRIQTTEAEGGREED